MSFRTKIEILRLKNMSKVVTIRMDSQIFELLKEIQAKTGFSRRKVLEYAISDYYLNQK